MHALVVLHLSLLRQYFEVGVNEVEEELGEMEGCAV